MDPFPESGLEAMMSHPMHQKGCQPKLVRRKRDNHCQRQERELALMKDIEPYRMPLPQSQVGYK